MKKPYYVNEKLLELAFQEDIGRGDITTNLTIHPGEEGTAVLTAKEPLILGGIEVAEYVYNMIDKKISCSSHRKDGESLIKGDIIAVFEGNLRSLLSGERIMLNFLQRLSGIASETRKFVMALGVHSARTKIVDTRKTTPGWRTLEKYAVTLGGGFNHRFGLDDGVLIKDNHIKAAGSISNAVKAAKTHVHHLMRIEVETTTLKEVAEAVNSGAHIIMLDNMDNETIGKAIALVDGKALIEVSGGVDEQRVKELAGMAVDFISCGKITHSATSKDISMNLEMRKI